MTFLPIVERELRARARRTVTYWARFMVGFAGALVFLTQLLADDSFGGSATGGRMVFQGLVVAAFVMCCVACFTTSDVISWERREGTLGLLFLTRVRTADVLLGKLASAALVSLCGLAAFLPMLMLPVLSGGVAGGEALRKGLMLLDTLFLALAVGLWASARGVESFKTARAAVGMVLTILIVPALFKSAPGPDWLPPYAVQFFSPLVGMETAGDAEYHASPSRFWASLALIQLLAWTLIFHARICLHRSLGEPTGATGAVPSARKVPERRQSFRACWTPLVGREEPIIWLLHRQKGVRPMIWVAVIFSATFYLARYLFSPWVGFNLSFMHAQYWALALFGSIVSGSVFAWAASRFFLDTRKSGELELLVTTPLGAKTIVTAQWTALKRMLRWPIILLLLPQGATLLSTWIIQGRVPVRFWFLYSTVSTIVSAVNMVVGIVVLCWLGMWFGLQTRTLGAAIVRVVAWGRLVPFAVSIVGSVFVMPVVRTLTPQSNYYPVGLVFTSWLPGLVTLTFYLWLLRRLRRRLLGDLRKAEPLAPNFRTIVAGSRIAIRRARHWTPT